ncbi:MAG: GNAT family N-acetyltransferase, partial [Bacteroidota bacterium]
MSQQKPEIEIMEVGPDVQEALISFFRLLKLHGIDHFFNPHPFNDKSAHERAYYSGQDYYCVMLNRKEILGYGMLRGWD